MHQYTLSVLATCGPLIGNKIGERHPETAKKIINSVLKFGLIYSLLCIAILFIFKTWIYGFYTKNESTLLKMYTITPIL